MQRPISAEVTVLSVIKEHNKLVMWTLILAVLLSCNFAEGKMDTGDHHPTTPGGLPPVPQASSSASAPVKDGGSDQTMSLVLDPGNTPDVSVNFIRLLQQPGDLAQGQTITVEYMCRFRAFAGLEVRVWSGLHSNYSLLRSSWSCSTHVVTPLRKHVTLVFPVEYAYRPSVRNPLAQTERRLLVQVYLVDEDVFKATKARSLYHAALIKSTYRARLVWPLSREERPLEAECLSWVTELLLSIPYRPTCPLEPREHKLVSFPVVFGEGKSGVHRVIPRHRDPVLERQRLEARANVKFTVVFWLYVEEHCKEPGLCSIFHHLTWDDFFMTPLIFMNKMGYLHIQIATEGSRAVAFLTNDFSVPLRQWFRLVIRCRYQKFEVDAMYGPALDTEFHTWYRFGTMDVVYLDHSVGLFSVGGSEMNKGFKGYVGEASYYRDYIELRRLRRPDPYHPMFQLGLEQRTEHCQDYINWLEYRVYQCEQMLKLRRLKKACSNYIEDILGIPSGPSKWPLAHCWKDEGPALAHFRHVNREVRRTVYSDQEVSAFDLGTQLYETAKSLVEEKGLDNSRNIIPLLRQASCYGNHDASFMLAAIFSKGIVVRTDEMQAIGYLQAGALANHRLCLMSLGNKHVHGLDGAPMDLEIAYAYYKHVADMTKGDRDRHLETDVFTEHVRLTDGEKLAEQTGEDGDLFLWFKHQAQLGEIHAMQNMGRLLFWGAQGVQRDLRQAAEFYRIGAVNGDAQSMHDYGIVFLKGQGVEKNMTLAKEWLEKAAEKGHVNAHNALGWFALEREHNYTLALKYFLFAHEHGNPDAAYNIGHMLHYGRLENQTADKVNAYLYFFAGAARGQFDAALMVAQIHQRGHPLYDRNPYTAVDWARFVSEQNPAVGAILHNGLKAYIAESWPAALLYYIMAAESGVEVGNFNLAYLCEQNVEGVVSQLQKECVYTHYNLSTLRYPHQVDPYAWIKMGDYHYQGLGGQKDVAQAAEAYCQAALNRDPHAMYNLGMLVEDGSEVPVSVWYRMNIAPEIYHNNASLLAELYHRCSESYKSEAYIPCSLSYYRVRITDIWQRHHLLIKMATVLSLLVTTLFTLPSMRAQLHANRASVQSATPV